MTLAALIAERKRLADLHDRAQLQSLPKDGAQFRQTVGDVAAGLKVIADAMLQDPEAPPLEIARSTMWLGDALFDLAQGRHIPFDQAVAAYRAADPYVRASRDATLSAKYAANFGNVLMRSNPSLPVLTEVVRLYELALPVLRKEQPQYAGVIATELARAQGLIQQWAAFERELEMRQQEARELAAAVARADVPPQTVAGIHDLLARISRARVSGDLGATLALLRDVPMIFGQTMRAVASAQSVGGVRGQVAAAMMELWSELLAVALATQTDVETRERALELQQRLVSAREAVVRGTAPDAVEANARRVLPTGAEARELLHRGHLAWSRPIWPVGAAQPLPGALHCTDSPRRDAIHRVASGIGIEHLDLPAGREPGEARFDAIRRAAVVVVDLDVGAEARADACHAMGIALALGRGLVVLTASDARATLPFDVDLAPVPTGGADWEMRALDAIERAFLLPQRPPAAANLTALVAAMRASFPDVPVFVDELARCVETPLRAGAVLEGLLREHDQRAGSAHLAIRPAWPRAWPADDRPRLFHVMPFGAPWSNAMRQRAATACERAGVVYRRGDEAADPRIIRSIWDETCLATHVLVDVTGLNANVCLELGFAHALGKHTLMVAQPDTVQQLFPALKKLRIALYATDDARFEDALATFLAEPG